MGCKYVYIDLIIIIIDTFLSITLLENEIIINKTLCCGLARTNYFWILFTVPLRLSFYIRMVYVTIIALYCCVVLYVACFLSTRAYLNTHTHTPHCIIIMNVWGRAMASAVLPRPKYTSGPEYATKRAVVVYGHLVCNPLVGMHPSDDVSIVRNRSMCVCVWFFGPSVDTAATL